MCNRVQKQRKNCFPVNFCVAFIYICIATICLVCVLLVYRVRSNADRNCHMCTRTLPLSELLRHTWTDQQYNFACILFVCVRYLMHFAFNWTHFLSCQLNLPLENIRRELLGLFSNSISMVFYIQHFICI